MGHTAGLQVDEDLGRWFDDVLKEIGALDVPQIFVWTKIDAVPELAARGGEIERDEYGKIVRVFLSARDGVGLDVLRAAITELITAPQGTLDPDDSLDGASAIDADHHEPIREHGA